MDTSPLPDRWTARDYPVLLATARRLEQGGDCQLHARDIDIDADVDAAWKALHEAGYLTGGRTKPRGGFDQLIVTGLTERGLRSTGLWPDQDAAAEALVELLDQAADHVTDEDEAGALRKAGRLLRSVPGAVLADIAAALIRQQTGID